MAFINQQYQIFGLEFHFFHLLTLFILGFLLLFVMNILQPVLERYWWMLQLKIHRRLNPEKANMENDELEEIFISKQLENLSETVKERKGSLQWSANGQTFNKGDYVYAKSITGHTLRGYFAGRHPTSGDSSKWIILILTVTTKDESEYAYRLDPKTQALAEADLLEHTISRFEKRFTTVIHGGE